MKRLLLLLLIASLFSCQDRFDTLKYQGTWVPLDENQSFAAAPFISFENNVIFFSDPCSYTKQGSYRILDEKLSIILADEAIENAFSFRKKDSSFLFGTTRYHLLPWILKDTLAKYPLLGYKTSYIISSDSLAKVDSGFHLFRDSKDSLRLKLNDQYSEFDRIPQFVFRTDSFHYPTHAIYLGENTTLQDLLLCYYQLARVNHLKVFLITNLRILKNEYSILPEKIELWDEQISTIFENEEPVHSNSVNTRKHFLVNYKPQILQINSQKDFIKIDSIKNAKNYLISINTNLSLNEYITLKEEILRMKKARKNTIRTEFILPPQDW